MYKALSVADYIIRYCNNHDYDISNLKLQKILYFIQAEFLVATPDNSPCFSDRIEAWDFGPVVPSVYRYYKAYGGNNIPSDRRDPLTPFYEMILPEHQKLIDPMLDETSSYSASQLVQITHNQAPWRLAYSPGQNNEITCPSILNYFGGTTHG